MSIVTDEEKVDEILSRSISAVYPTLDSVRTALLCGKRLSIYVGIDPTATYVHLGHSTNYLILERLHKLGHRIVVLVGDFTAMIGDPTDKAAARVPLTREQITHNVKTFKEQIGKILDFDDKTNPIEFKFNSEWLGKLSIEDFIQIASQFTVQQMLERDMFEKRLAENKPLHVHELFYPLLQGFDSVALETDIEIGGTDQTFNMLAGRTLVKRLQNREKFVITTTLLENPVTGEKLMSKSLGTGIGLDEDADSMFGKTMALPDEGIIQAFVDCTRLPLATISEKKTRMEQGANPRDIKLELAHEIVRMYHGASGADQAQGNWIETFTKSGVPENIKEISLTRSITLLDALVEHSIVASKSEARRLFVEGAVRNTETDEKIMDMAMVMNHTMIIKIGKKQFVKFVI